MEKKINTITTRNGVVCNVKSLQIGETFQMVSNNRQIIRNEVTAMSCNRCIGCYMDLIKTDVF